MERETIDTYVVTETKRGWAVTLNGHLLASGMERTRAEHAAGVAARMSDRRGRKAEIRVDEGSDGIRPAAIRGELLQAEMSL